MAINDGKTNLDGSVPWREMFHTAASPKATIPRGLRSSFSTGIIQYPRSLSHTKEESETQSSKSLRSTPTSTGRVSTNLLASYPLNEPSDSAEDAELQGQHAYERKVVCSEDEEVWKFNKESFQLAVYIAMAHAGLIFLVLVLYGVWKLLKDYRRPIQWAVLCSMPLREIQHTMVTFWEPALKKGLVQTLTAIPFAFFKSVIGTLMDIALAFQCLTRKSNTRRRRNVRFSILMQWLLSFAILALFYEWMGAATLATSAFVGTMTYAAGTSMGLFEPMTGHVDNDATWSILSAKQVQQAREAKSWLRWVLSPFICVYNWINVHLTRGFVAHLHTLIAVSLISIMILGSISGLVLFSYKIGLEGKDAVVALKTHVQNSNYAEKIGLKQWIEDNKIPELLDTYAAKGYETVSQHIDVFAAQYNMTELANEAKHHILQFSRGKNTDVHGSENFVSSSTHPVLEKMYKIKTRFREYDIKGIYFELEEAASIILEHFQMSKEDIISKAKQVGQRWSAVGKQVATGSSTLVAGSISIFLSVASSIATGAAEIFNFITQAFVFFSLLYYLITSKSGGVMYQVLGMVPLSESTRKQCATLLDHTVSSLLLATAKSAIFQAVFTWILFRFLNLHFLYTSTMLAFISTVLPFIPSWLPTLVAGAQLAFEEHYMLAIFVMAGHMWFMDFGVSAIQDGIPGYNAYLTGLSIAGGMALFSPALEGAILGPLIMTLLISLKKLYTEFVLDATKK